MRLSINNFALKATISALAVVCAMGFGYLGCQYLGRTATFTAAGCLGGLGGTAALIEVAKPVRVTKE